MLYFNPLFSNKATSLFKKNRLPGNDEIVKRVSVHFQRLKATLSCLDSEAECFEESHEDSRQELLQGLDTGMVHEEHPCANSSVSYRNTPPECTANAGAHHLLTDSTTWKQSQSLLHPLGQHSGVHHSTWKASPLPSQSHNNVENEDHCSATTTLPLNCTTNDALAGPMDGTRYGNETSWKPWKSAQSRLDAVETAPQCFLKDSNHTSRPHTQSERSSPPSSAEYTTRVRTDTAWKSAQSPSGVRRMKGHPSRILGFRDGKTALTS